MTEVYQNILVINDEPELTRLSLELCAALGIRGFAVKDADAAIRQLQAGRWNLVLVGISDGRQFELARVLRETQPDLPMVLAGAEDCSQAAVQALRQGYRDYLVRPVTRKTLEALFAELLPHHDVPTAAAGLDENRCHYRIAGNSPALVQTIRMASKLAASSVPVLVTGESGSGKELIAHLLHHRSPRAQGPFVRVNCAALSESLLESELFGHERGAFTGACAQRKGRFERAHGGTLLLDEISETGPRLQAELLRVMEQQDFERVGGSEAVRVNVRVLTTSNRDLAQEVQAGRFRKDLYYRISGVHLRVPPLRERKEDIAVLVWHFVNLHAGEVRRNIERLDERMLEAFWRHDWPGNIRELRNVVRTALIMGEGPVLSLRGLPIPLAAPPIPTSPAPGESPEQDLSLQELERQAVFEALRRTRRNQVKAARLLGITDRTLREKLKRYRQSDLQVTGETA